MKKRESAVVVYPDQFGRWKIMKAKSKRELLFSSSPTYILEDLPKSWLAREECWYGQPDRK